MPLPPSKNRTAYGTYLCFVEPGTMEKFLQNSRRLLMDNFQQIRIKGDLEHRTCGQDLDPRYFNWKPCQHLERLCLKRGLDDFAARDILVEHLGRKLECVHQILYDERKL